MSLEHHFLQEYAHVGAGAVAVDFVEVYEFVDLPEVVDEMLLGVDDVELVLEELEGKNVLDVLGVLDVEDVVLVVNLLDFVDVACAQGAKY